LPSGGAASGINPGQTRYPAGRPACGKGHSRDISCRAGRRRGEPIGSGPVEATCRQTQCRFKRPGQFWSQAGDEALMYLEMFWRNGRWHRLFPHASSNPARN
jgi:hypothetical protein